MLGKEIKDRIKVDTLYMRKDTYLTLSKHDLEVKFKMVLETYSVCMINDLGPEITVLPVIRMTSILNQLLRYYY